MPIRLFSKLLCVIIFMKYTKNGETIMPHLNLKKIKNCRDLGHLTTTDGRKIKSAMLIRSEALSKASKKDIKTLTEKYGLKTIIDFRTVVECEQKPDPVINGVEYIHNPILREETLGITREKVDYKDMPKLFENETIPPMEYMQSLYTSLVLDDNAKENYKNFFDILINGEGAFLWHCTAGKDRVGIGTALLLSALNVDREAIIKDYMLTDYYNRKENKKLKFLIKVGIRNKKIKMYLRHLLSVKPEYIDASFSAIEKNYGSVENYLHNEMGLTHEKLLILRNKFLA